jgi:Right handed beta helix region
MTKTALLLALIVTALASMPAHAQRAFVSAFGVDTNPCSVDLPCRTWQQAFNTVPANGEIYVLDTATYGPLIITHGITIQAHGVGAVVQTGNGAAITVAVTTSDPVTLNGLLLDGGGTGQFGISITSGPSVQILNSVIRHFQFGIYDQTNTLGSTLLIEDTVASDNKDTGIVVSPFGNTRATLNRITANNNQWGIASAGTADTTVANSVMSNNSNSGLTNDGGGAVFWLAKSVISGNFIGVNGTVNTYGDNYIRDNVTPVNGTLTPVGMQ